VEGPAATGTQAEPAPADAGPVSLEELLAQIDALEAKIESNKFRSAQAVEARDKLHRSPRSQSKDLEELALVIRDLSGQIRSDAAQLKDLKRRVQEIERSLEQR
jgi:chromosome segregation ATPase